MGGFLTFQYILTFLIIMNDKNINVDLKQMDDYTISFFGKKISTATMIIIISWFVGIVIVCGFTLFEGLQSFFKYHDQIMLNEHLNWLLRKDLLDLPMEPLIVSLLGITLIFGGVEISTSWFINRDTKRGDVKPLPKKQRERLLWLVAMWFVMMLIITIGKMKLGTRGVNYNEAMIYSGFGESFVLYTMASRASKLANYSHKSQEETAAEMVKIVKEEMNKQSVEEGGVNE